MIMITDMKTVQLYIKVDGGIIRDVITLTSTHNHLM